MLIGGSDSDVTSAVALLGGGAEACTWAFSVCGMRSTRMRLKGAAGLGGGGAGDGAGEGVDAALAVFSRSMSTRKLSSSMRAPGSRVGTSRLKDESSGLPCSSSSVTWGRREFRGSHERA